MVQNVTLNLHSFHSHFPCHGQQTAKLALEGASHFARTGRGTRMFKLFLDFRECRGEQFHLDQWGIMVGVHQDIDSELGSAM